MPKMNTETPRTIWTFNIIFNIIFIIITPGKNRVFFFNYFKVGWSILSRRLDS